VPERDDRVLLPVTAAVLAGGRSLRMGVDKTLLDFDGEPLLARVIAAVRSVCAEVMVVTNRPEALEDVDLDDHVSVVSDDVPYQGPLGGLATALAHAEQEWVLAVAADMPWLEPDVVRALYAASDGADAVVPMTDKGPEPLLALYRVEACREAAAAALASGRRRLVAVLQNLHVAEIPISDLRDVDPALHSFVNVNTPEDLADVRASVEESADEVSSAGEIVSEGPEPVSQAHPRVVEVGTRRGRGMPSERPVTVYMNDVEIATVQATPSDLEEMAIGFMLTEGLLTDRDALQGIDVDLKRGLVYVTTEEHVPDDMVFRTRYVTSGCGKGVTFSSVGHARGLEPIVSDVRVSSQEIYDMMVEMARTAERYRETGGMHSCALGRDGKLLVVREDVGRHNALDKVLGRAWLDRISAKDAVLLTTGRISYEMAVKAAKSRVPVVVSRTAVTDLAAEIAETLGITLVGYARGSKIVIHTHPERITEAPE